MPLPVALLFFGLLLLTTLAPPASWSVTPAADAMAASLLVQHGAAVRAFEADPSLSGIQPVSALSTPNGFQPAGNWVSQISGGDVVTYWLPPAAAPIGAAAVAGALVRATAGTTVTGVAQAGSVTPSAGGSPVPLSGVPAGAVVAVTRVRG